MRKGSSEGSATRGRPDAKTEGTETTLRSSIEHGPPVLSVLSVLSVPGLAESARSSPIGPCRSPNPLRHGARGFCFIHRQRLALR
jgi:hypothetical protein